MCYIWHSNVLFLDKSDVSGCDVWRALLSTGVLIWIEPEIRCRKLTSLATYITGTEQFYKDCKIFWLWYVTIFSSFCFGNSFALPISSGKWKVLEVVVVGGSGKLSFESQARNPFEPSICVLSDLTIAEHGQHRIIESHFLSREMVVTADAETVKGRCPVSHGQGQGSTCPYSQDRWVPQVPKKSLHISILSCYTYSQDKNWPKLSKNLSFP